MGEWGGEEFGQILQVAVKEIRVTRERDVKKVKKLSENTHTHT